MVAGKWVNFTFVDLDAQGSADCLATFKLGHDNKHATQGPVSQQRTLNKQTTTWGKKKKKKTEINKMCGSKEK